MLCEKCNKQEAVLHFTENWAGASTSKETNLCADCARLFRGLEGISNLDAVLNGAPCRYCGGEPYSGGGDPIAGLSGVRKVSFMCKPCAEEYSRFVCEKLPGFGDAGITDEQVANIHKADKAAVFRKVEEHMKKWVAERRSE